MNLLVNALRYSDPARKPVIHICSSIEKGQPVLRFSDNGLGMNMARVRDKIFGLYQKFFTTTLKAKGLAFILCTHR